MHALLTLIHWLAAVAILAEALNKTERTDPLAVGLTPRERLAEWLKAAAWVLLALGAAGAVVSPLLPPGQRELADYCIVIGFAVLVVRTRVKEG